MNPRGTNTCNTVDKTCLCVQFVFCRNSWSFRTVNRSSAAIHSSPELSSLSLGVTLLFSNISSKLENQFVRLKPPFANNDFRSCITSDACEPREAYRPHKNYPLPRAMQCFMFQSKQFCTLLQGINCTCF